LEVIYLDKIINKNTNKELFEILKECDNEFFPPLSHRNQSTQMNLQDDSGEISLEGPIEYFNDMISQKFLIAKEKNKIIGFMTFIDDYKSEIYKDFIKKDVNFYITTICVLKNHRGRGICGKFYDTIEKLALNNECKTYISTRTWSKNISHINILAKRGYKKIKTIDNDRGEGIDTIYFLKNS